MTDQELINYYANLLIIQYKQKPKAYATVSLLAEQGIANQISRQVLDGFDPETAIGKQLDVLAEYEHLQRNIAGFAPAVLNMAFKDYSDATLRGGFADYSDVTAPYVYFASYFTLPSSYVLSDGQLRDLLRYVVSLRTSDLSNESIDQILYDHFGTYVTFSDNADMTITYTHDATSDPNLLFEIVDYLGLLPKPAGVEVIVVVV